MARRVACPLPTDNNSASVGPFGAGASSRLAIALLESWAQNCAIPHSLRNLLAFNLLAQLETGSGGI